MFRGFFEWWRNIFRKRRFTMTNTTTNDREWYILISPMGILSGAIAVCLTIFIIQLTLVAYTPVLELLPGYQTDANRSRKVMIESIVKIDSMQRVMSDMMTYNENIALIMQGKTPVARSILKPDTLLTSKGTVARSTQDSLLRSQIEGSGAYSLESTNTGQRSTRQLREAIELTPPADGEIVASFNPAEGRNSVTIANLTNQMVVAIDNGSVVQSHWTPDYGYIVAIQHKDNTLSIYKNLSQGSVEVGQMVLAGEEIGHKAARKAEDGDNFKDLEFELWSSGKAVNPESYILF